MYTIYYQEKGAPKETRVGMVSAPNETIAHRVASSLFANSKILGIDEISPPEEETKYPGARFIKGKFYPVGHLDDVG